MQFHLAPGVTAEVVIRGGEPTPQYLQNLSAFVKLQADILGQAAPGASASSRTYTRLVRGV